MRFHSSLVECGRNRAFPQNSARQHSAEIADHWRRRWLSPRTGRAGILDAVAQRNLAYPIRHGAAVLLPPNGDEPDLFG
jgi:hypothetical protein